MTRPFRARRCQLAVPASSDKMMEKAAALGVDHVFLDLEDAVAPDEKPAARAKAAEALVKYDWGRTVRCVRINDLESRWAFRDVIEVVERAGEHLDTIMLPKVRTASDIQWLDKLLNQLEADVGLTRKIGIEALIEEVEAMENIETIAKSSPRLEALIFGMGDYTASQGVNVPDIGDTADYPGDLWHYCRSRLIIACRVAGIDPIDGPFANFRNEEGYRREARRAFLLGAVGKWAIHPSQIAPAVETFSPSNEEVANARKIVAAYADAVARGLGSVQVDGTMVDAASLRIFEAVIRKAERFGL